MKRISAKIYTSKFLPLDTSNSMSFEIEHITIGSSSIYLLHYSDFNPTEYLDRLTELELERYHTFSHIKRKREFVATRILRHQLFGFEHIHYDEHGAPYIDSEGFISVSHCNGSIGIALNKEFQVGLDLEVPRPQITQLADKFLSAHERDYFDISDPMELTKIWSAKEALYKLAGRKEIIFSKDLLLEDKDELSWNARILNKDHERKIKLHIFEHKGMIVTINKQPITFV